MADEQKQAPEKPAKKSGGMPMPMMIGIGAGVIIVNIIIVVLVIKFLFPSSPEDENMDKAKQEQKKDDFDFSEDEESDFFLDEESVKYFETGRIMTNPKDAAEYLAIVDLGLEYRVTEDYPMEKLKEDGPLMQKIMARIRGVVTQTLGSKTVPELHNERVLLAEHFLKELRPVFKDQKIFLREVIVKEFLIQ